MIKRLMSTCIAAAAVVANLCTAPCSFGEPKKNSPAEAIHVLKISHEDANAVIKTADGKMQIVHAGDVLLIEDTTVKNLGKKADEKETPAAELLKEVRITEIGKGRVVVEERTDKGADTVIISLENGKQKNQRISRFGGDERVLKAPKTEVVRDIKN